MLSDPARTIQYAIVWVIVFAIGLMLSIVLPEGLRRRWPIALAGVAATAVVAIEAATEEQTLQQQARRR